MKDKQQSSRSVRDQVPAATRRPTWASSLSAPMSRRLRLEPLESRQLLTAVSWDGGGDGTNWSDPINWSANALPGAADDVTINVVGAITVTHASGNTTIRSVNSAENLVISGGSFTVTNGASVVSGAFTINPNLSLTAFGATATFTASGATTFDGSHLFASAGGQINLPLATSYAETAFTQTQFIANGTGSQIDLSGLTSLTGNGAVNIYAQAGGTIKMSALASTTARNLSFQTDGATSLLDLSALTNATDVNRQNSLSLLNGGVLTAPVLATFAGGTIIVTNMSASIPTLTNIDTSFLNANANGILTLPGVTSYAEAAFNQTQFIANGVNAKIDLSNLTSLTGTTGAMNIYAQAGGTIKMSGLASTTARALNFLTDGATSLLDLSSLTNATDVNRQNSLSLLNGGVLTAPVLATFAGGNIIVTNMSASIPTLTNIDTSSLFANANGILTLAGVTSYAEAAFNQTQFVANGVNAKIDLASLTSLTGATGAMNIYAQSGGTVKISALMNTAARALRFYADGATSVLNLTALTTVTDTTLQSSLSLYNGGVLTAPVLATYSGGSIVVQNMSASLPTITNIDNSSLYANANGILTMTGATSYAEAPFSQTQFIANGVNAMIDLPNLTSITGTTGAMNIYAQNGGTTKISALVSTAARDLNFYADGATSVLNLTALTTVTDTTLQSSLTLWNGGSLTAPALATYSGGGIFIKNKTASIPSLTNIDSSSLLSEVGGILTLSGVTSYAEAPFNQAQFIANGANAKVDLPNLASLSGANGALNIYAQAGGTMELSAVVNSTARFARVYSDGVSSVVNLTALTNFSDASAQSSVTVVNNGSVMLGAGTSTLTGVAVAASSAGVVSGGTIQLSTNSLLYGNGGTLQANVVNGVTMVPGASLGSFLGKINFIGSYSQSASGNYAVELNGLTPVTQHDQIGVQGTVSLGGTLTITRGFTPVIGDSFVIIENDGVDPVIGTFAGAPRAIFTRSIRFPSACPTWAARGTTSR